MPVPELRLSQPNNIYQSLRNSRSFKNTVFSSGLAGRSGKASRNLSMTLELPSRKNVLISFSKPKVVTIA